MKYLFSFVTSCLFIVSCTCDEPYCPLVEEILIEINYSDDFTLEELRRSNLVILDTVNQVIINSHNLLSVNSTRRNTFIDYYGYYYDQLPSMDNIFILNFDNFSDTIRNLRYDANEIESRCNVGCHFDIYRNINFTELNNFYLTYRGDTIRNKTVFIEK